MPEWSNGSALGADGLVPTQVRILLSAYFIFLKEIGIRLIGLREKGKLARKP